MGDSGQAVGKFLYEKLDPMLTRVEELAIQFKEWSENADSARKVFDRLWKTLSRVSIILLTLTGLAGLSVVASLIKKIGKAAFGSRQSKWLGQVAPKSKEFGGGIRGLVRSFRFLLPQLSRLCLLYTSPSPRD